VEGAEKTEVVESGGLGGGGEGGRGVGDLSYRGAAAADRTHPPPPPHTNQYRAHTHLRDARIMVFRPVAKIEFRNHKPGVVVNSCV